MSHMPARLDRPVCSTLPLRADALKRVYAAFAFVALAFCAGLAHAQELLAIPALSAHVIDTSNTLSAAQRDALEAKLVAFEAASGSQVVVWILPSTAPEDISSLANRAANTWKIGRKDIGDGVLLIVAKNDRKLRIEVAKSLEGAIPDLAAKRVIEQAISPRFKQGDFAGGLNAGTEQIMALIQREGLPQQTAQRNAPRGKDVSTWMDWLVLALLAFPIGSAIVKRALGSKLGSVVAGGAVAALVMLITTSMLLAIGAGVVAAMLSLLMKLPSDLGRYRNGPFGGFGGGTTGGWRSGSFGGGFGSGGGGDFGGGGASGNW